MGVISSTVFMQIITDLEQTVFPKNSCAITIGNFDGVHLGHLTLLQQMRNFLPKEGILTVYTFTNHPSEVLSHASLIPSIYTLEHKLKIFEEVGVDYAILSPFTKQSAQTGFREFLFAIKKACNLSFLVLGEGAAFGKNKEGTEKAVQNLAKEWNFEAKYLPKKKIEGHLVSSSQIRTLIASGQFASVQHYLGRPYSLYAPLLIRETSTHLAIEKLCLPPSGVYPVEVRASAHVYSAQAHIDRHNQLVHLVFDPAHSPAETSFVEVIFLSSKDANKKELIKERSWLH